MAQMDKSRNYFLFEEDPDCFVAIATDKVEVDLLNFLKEEGKETLVFFLAGGFQRARPPPKKGNNTGFYRAINDKKIKDEAPKPLTYMSVRCEDESSMAEAQKSIYHDNSFKNDVTVLPGIRYLNLTNEELAKMEKAPKGSTRLLPAKKFVLIEKNSLFRKGEELYYFGKARQRDELDELDELRRK